MSKENIVCGNCQEEFIVNLIEFADVSEDPEYKRKIIDGSFFLTKCPNCGAETFLEYPVMYMDPDKKLTVYLAPDHDEELLQQLNSLEVPADDVDPEAKFRLVDCGEKLLEKILLADGGRDDRIMELYKAVICENAREDFPQLQPEDLLYCYGEGEEYFLCWGCDNDKGEQMTIDISDDIYEDLMDNYMEPLMLTPCNYAEVDANWLRERIEVEA